MLIKILLVEDNELNAEMLQVRLQRTGYEVIWAKDGSQGISLAKSQLPHIILMDLSLPIIDGWTAASELKQAKETNHIPIIALTAHAMSGDRAKALKAGCDEYDTKPIEYERLLNKIQSCLNITCFKSQ